MMPIDGSNTVTMKLTKTQFVAVFKKHGFSQVGSMIKKAQNVAKLQHLYGSRYSRIDQVKFVEDSLEVIWSAYTYLHLATDVTAEEHLSFDDDTETHKQLVH